MSVFERYLTLWIALAIALGIGIGATAPGLVEAVAAAEVASVNLVVAVLIWAMVYPMMVGVDLQAVAGVARQPKGLLITLAVNWLIKPFTMAFLAVLFFDYVFAPWIEPEDAAQYTAGLILLGAAPCTAMVFVWSQLTRGDATYTLVQVSVNDLVMVVAYAPLVAFLLGVTDIAVPWETLVLATVLYIVLPLIAGLLTRRRLGSPEAIDAFSARIKPWSMMGLITTVVILFGLQGEKILANPVVIAMIAVPISLFGLGSGAALATVVGVLVEVPVMLTLVAFANRTRKRFPQSEEDVVHSSSRIVELD